MLLFTYYYNIRPLPLADPGGGRRQCAPTPTGSISFVFAYVFAEKCTCWRSAPPPPPTQNPGSATDYTERFPVTVTLPVFSALRPCAYYAARPGIINPCSIVGYPGHTCQDPPNPSTTFPGLFWCVSASGSVSESK